jgi:hypothetical protein
MKIVIDYIADIKITLETKTDTPDDPQSVTLTIDPPSNESSLKLLLLNDYRLHTAGYYGHILPNFIDGENVTNLDLQTASAQLQFFNVVSSEPTIEPTELPQGAVS